MVSSVSFPKGVSRELGYSAQTLLLLPGNCLVEIRKKNPETNDSNFLFHCRHVPGKPREFVAEISSLELPAVAVANV